MPVVLIQVLVVSLQLLVVKVDLTVATVLLVVLAAEQDKAVQAVRVTQVVTLQ